MSKPNIAVYALGCIYPDSGNVQPVTTTISQLQQSGFSTVILSLFHIGRDYEISPKQIMGDIYYNNTLVISKGHYVGDQTWPGLINGMIGGTVSQVCASFGGGGVLDFQTVKRIYDNNHQSFAGTNLIQNLQLLRKLFPTISIIDMDCEETYDQASFIAFCEMLVGIGFGITFCPYNRYEMDFWTGSLNALHVKHPGSVKWWNLQSYSGGTGNDPAYWANEIKQAIPGFSTNGFILASDWSRFLVYENGAPQYWNGDCPLAVQALMGKFEGEPSVGGGFVWTLDQIIDYDHNNKKMKDPDYCADAASMPAYVKAITTGLGT